MPVQHNGAYVMGRALTPQEQATFRAYCDGSAPRSPGIGYVVIGLIWHAILIFFVVAALTANYGKQDVLLGAMAVLAAIPCIGYWCWLAWDIRTVRRYRGLFLERTIWKQLPKEVHAIDNWDWVSKQLHQSGSYFGYCYPIFDAWLWAVADSVKLREKIEATAARHGKEPAWDPVYSDLGVGIAMATETASEQLNTIWKSAVARRAAQQAMQDMQREIQAANDAAISAANQAAEEDRQEGERVREAYLRTQTRRAFEIEASAALAAAQFYASHPSPFPSDHL